MTATTDPIVGRTLAGRYVVEKRIGQGGMGAVYVGTQQPLGRRVAIKVLLGGLSSDSQARERFQREATAVASLNHPGIVTVYDFGQTEDGTWFIAMELVSGQTLKSILDTHKRLSWPKAVDIAKQTATALGVAHDKGIVHRDLKPENIMLVAQSDGTFLVKILDFGLAKMAEGAAGGDVGPGITNRSVIMGTPGFMSPEQIQGQPIDHRCDLYALGAILWEMVVGHPPINNDTPIKILMRHLTETIPAPSTARPEAAIPHRGDQLILRLLEKDRERRPERTSDVAAALAALAAEPWVAPVAIALGPAPDAGDWDIAFKALDQAPKGAVVGVPDTGITAVVSASSLPPIAPPDPPAPAVTTAIVPPPPPPPWSPPAWSPPPEPSPELPREPSPSSTWSPPPAWSPAPTLPSAGPPSSAFRPPAPPLAAPSLQLAGPRGLELERPAREPAGRTTTTSSVTATRAPAARTPMSTLTKRIIAGVSVLAVASVVHFVVRGGLGGDVVGSTATGRVDDIVEVVAAREQQGSLRDIDAALARARLDAIGPLGSARLAELLIERARLRGDVDDADRREGQALLISLIGDDVAVARARAGLVLMLDDGSAAAAKRTAGATATLEALAKDDARARLLLAEHLWRSDPRRARALLEQPLPAGTGTRAARVKGAVALLHGEFTAAARHLDERLAAAPDDATARGLRALVRLGQGNRAAARADVDATGPTRGAVATMAELLIVASDETPRSPEVARAFDAAMKATIALPAPWTAMARATRTDALRTRKDVRTLGMLVDDKETVRLAGLDTGTALARARALLALGRRDDVTSALALVDDARLTPAQQSHLGALRTRARLTSTSGNDAFARARPLSLVAALAANPADPAAAVALFVAAPIPLPTRLDDDERLVLDGLLPADPVAKAMRELLQGASTGTVAVARAKPKDETAQLLMAAHDLDSGRLDAAAARLLAIEAGRTLEPRLQDAAKILGLRLAAARREPDVATRLTRLRQDPAAALCAWSVLRVSSGDVDAAARALIALDVLSARARELVE